MGSHVIVAGAGIVGLATAFELTRRGHSVTVLEKESSPVNIRPATTPASFTPGSTTRPAASRPRWARPGQRRCGASPKTTGSSSTSAASSWSPPNPSRCRRCRSSTTRAGQWRPVRMISAEQAREYEPYVSAVSALRVESTGIVDFRGVCDASDVTSSRRAARSAQPADRRDRVAFRWRDGHDQDRRVSSGSVRQLCRAALRSAGPTGRTGAGRADHPVPRGVLRADAGASYLVKGLIYPVPDPTLPFLGVHLTRMINGGVHAGPNAVFALAREGYTKLTINPRDVADSLRWPGLWRLGRRYWRTGVGEAAIAVREAVPGQPARARAGPSRRLSAADACRGPRPGAAPRRKTGRRLLLRAAPRQVHVLNAPSPAATASLEIGKRIADEMQLSSLA